MNEADRKFDPKDFAKIKPLITTSDRADLFVRMLPNPNEGVIFELAGDSETFQIILEHFLRQHFLNNPPSSDVTGNAQRLLERFSPWKESMLEGYENSDLSQDELSKLSKTVNIENAVNFAKHKADKHRALYKKNRLENTFKEYVFWKKIGITAKYAHEMEINQRHRSTTP